MYTEWIFLSHHFFFFHFLKFYWVMVIIVQTSMHYFSTNFMLVVTIITLNAQKTSNTQTQWQFAIITVKGLKGGGWKNNSIHNKKKSFVRSLSAVILFLKSGSRQSAAISARGAICWHLMHRSLKVLSLSRATNPSTSGVGVDDEGRVMGDETIVRWTWIWKQTSRLSTLGPLSAF